MPGVGHPVLPFRVRGHRPSSFSDVVTLRVRGRGECGIVEERFCDYSVELVVVSYYINVNHLSIFLVPSLLCYTYITSRHLAHW